MANISNQDKKTDAAAKFEQFEREANMLVTHFETVAKNQKQAELSIRKISEQVEARMKQVAEGEEQVAASAKQVAESVENASKTLARAELLASEAQKALDRAEQLAKEAEHWQNSAERRQADRCVEFLAQMIEADERVGWLFQNYIRAKENPEFPQCPADAYDEAAATCGVKGPTFYNVEETKPSFIDAQFGLFAKR